MNNFSVAIPTFNRKDDLEKALDCILRSTIYPSEVLIIDDGELGQKFVEDARIKLASKNIRLVYYKKDHSKERRGTSISRNIAMSMTQEDIIFIIDDDLRVNENFFEKIMEAWNANVENTLIGVGGVMSNYRGKSTIEKLFNIIFALDSNLAWDVNDAAMQVWDDYITRQSKVYYVHGGACSYRRSLALRLPFSVFTKGREALEDVDFCLRAKNAGFHFIIEPAAKAVHLHSKINRENNFQIGLKESRNRKIIFKNNCRQNFKNRFLFYWANLGWILRQLLVGHFAKAAGLVAGLFTRQRIDSK